MAGSALIVIDMINTHGHQDAELLLPAAEAAMPGTVSLLDRARVEGIPVIYANDNWGHWRSHHGAFVDEVLARATGRSRGTAAPGRGVPLHCQGQHSIFYETPLTELGVDQVVLTGQVTEQCVLYSALDAHIRHLGVVVPADAVAVIHPDPAEAALTMMRRNMGSGISRAAEVVW
ncbi:isochorismatase family protein [Streptomyces sp. NPDC127033]|uniref:isochorismatase family protein n=1 Tax=Streptomyces sp. NPDC127033 TaxID=3347110 RepID=UPI003652AAE3